MRYMAESKKVTVRLAPELVERLQRIADKRWMTPSQVLRDYIVNDSMGDEDTDVGKDKNAPPLMSEDDDCLEFAESAEERRGKDGRYKKGCLFFVLLYCPTKTAVHRIRTCSYVNEFAAAAHDLDVYSQEDMEKALKKGRIPDWKVGELKKHHVHAFLRCSQVRPDTLASALEIPVNHVQYVKKTKVFGCLSYLTHALWPEKHLYDDSEVISNYDWKAERDGTKRVNVLEDILSRIDSGEITENNYVHMLPIATAVKYERQMQSAFRLYRRKHAHEASS